MISGPEGASFEYMQPFIEQIEDRLLPLVDQGEIEGISVRAPGGFGPGGSFNSGSIQVVLTEWGHRRNGFDIVNDVNRRLSDITGVRAFAMVARCLPLLFPFWAPLALVAAGWAGAGRRTAEEDGDGDDDRRRSTTTIDDDDEGCRRKLGDQQQPPLRRSRQKKHDTTTTR